MTPGELLTDAVQRTAEGVDAVLEDLTADQLTWRPGPDANPIGWLVWHLLRVQDDHLADAFGREQVWLAQRYAGRFELPYDDAAHGYGQTSEQVGAFRVEPALLREYAAAVHAQTLDLLAGVTEADLDRVVDDRWDPPVTLGVRLVSVADDCAQHHGQAAYVKGLLPAG